MDYNISLGETGEIDILVYQDSLNNLNFVITEDGSIYDMTGSTALFSFDGGNTQVSGSIDIPSGTISITLTSTHTAVLGNFEYILYEDFGLSSERILSKGNLLINELVGFSDSIDAFIVSETPSSLELDTNWKNQKVYYWKYYLKDLVDPNISTQGIHNDSNWPVLVRSLIAKLVIYDALTLALRGSLIAFTGDSQSGSSSQGSGGVKKIETGPANTEFYDLSQSLSSLLKPNSNGATAYDTLIKDICMLAIRLSIKLPICKDIQEFPKPPKYHKRI